MISKVSLRPLKSTDLDAFMTWAGDAEVTATLMWDHYKDKVAAEKFLIEVVEKHEWFMAICLNEIPVGAITLTKKEGSGKCRAELGYVIAKTYWGKGLATQAVKLCLQQGYTDLGISRIEALVAVNHISSIRVLENAGLVREALLKNYLVHRGQVVDRYLYGHVCSE